MFLLLCCKSPYNTEYYHLIHNIIHFLGQLSHHKTPTAVIGVTLRRFVHFGGCEEIYIHTSTTYLPAYRTSDNQSSQTNIQYTSSNNIRHN